MSAPTRREALAWLAGVGAAILVACDDGSDADPPGPDGFVGPDLGLDAGVAADALPPTTVDLAALVGAWVGDADRGALAAIGLVYLASFAEETGRAADLAVAVDLVAEVEDPAAAVPLWTEAIAADYAETVLASVGGWQLARTEARLCALVETVRAAEG